MTTPTPNDLDLYINDIVDKLRAKYGYADKNRLKNRVRFYIKAGDVFDEFNHNVGPATEVIELTYTELEESMNKNELPKPIQKIL